MQNKIQAWQRPNSEGVRLRRSAYSISWGYLTRLILSTVNWLPGIPRLECSHGMVVLSGQKLRHHLLYRWRCRKALDPLPLPWWILFGWLRASLALTGRCASTRKKYSQGPVNFECVKMHRSSKILSIMHKQTKNHLFFLIDHID